MLNWLRGRGREQEPKSPQALSPSAPQSCDPATTQPGASLVPSSAAGLEVDEERMTQLAQELRRAKELATNGTPGGTMAALQMVTDMIRETNGGREEAVMDALRKAKEEHRQVIAAVDRPGPNWKLLMPVASGAL